MIHPFLFIFPLVFSLISSIPTGSMAETCGSDQTFKQASRGELRNQLGELFNTDFGQTKPLSKPIRPGQSTTITKSLPGGTKHLRLKIKIQNGAGPWSLSVRDKDHRLIQSFSNEKKSLQFLWTIRVPGDTASFYLEVPNGSTPPKMWITKYIAMPTKSTTAFYSVLDSDKPTFVPLFPKKNKASTTNEYQRKLGDSTGLFMTSFGKNSWCCSGAMVGKNLFLTNWHCGGPKHFTNDQIWEKPSICSNALIDFSWDNDEISHDYQCVEVLDKNRQRDYVLLKIAPMNLAGQVNPATIDMGASSPSNLMVIQHPGCRPKQIVKSCNILNPKYTSPMGNTPVDFTHNCDTATGSSGSPVFDDKGKMVGLHHLGFFKNSDGTCDKQNKAVWINEIINEIQKKVPDIEKQIKVN
jgi:V8-like Glu-specific endopeptidase